MQQVISCQRDSGALRSAFYWEQQAAQGRWQRAAETRWTELAEQEGLDIWEESIHSASRLEGTDGKEEGETHSKGRKYCMLRSNIVFYCVRFNGSCTLNFVVLKVQWQ